MVRAVGGAFEDALRNLGRERRRHEKSLNHVDVEIDESIELGSGFDALGNRVFPQIPRHGDDRFHDLEAVLVLQHARNKGVIDLQRVDLEPAQVGERRISSSEVIDADRDVEGSQLLEHGQGVLGVIHEHALGDLELEALTVEAAVAEDEIDAGNDVRAHELGGGEVDRHRCL